MSLLRRTTVAVLCAALTGVAVSADSAHVSRVTNMAEFVADDEARADLWRLYRNRHYGELLTKARSAALEGSPAAQYILGELLLVGSDLDGDRSEAIAWLERAAAADSPVALARLAWIYRAGPDFDRDLERSRKLRSRWAFATAAYAQVNADKTKPFLLVHRPGEGPIHRYWTERAGYFVALGNRLSSKPTNVEIEVDTTSPPASLAAACRPDSPPVAAMNALKLDRVEGTVVILLDNSGRIEGIVVDKISDSRMRVGTLDVFQRSLRSRDCDLTVRGFNRPIEIPFAFQLQ